MEKWKMSKNPELVKVPIDIQKYKQNLAELAEILLQYFGQLDSKLVPLVSPAKPVSCHDRGQPTGGPSYE